MCDYSLFAVPNRLAREHEDLVAHRFPTGSMGLASPTDLERRVQPGPGKRKGLWAAIRDFLNPPVLSPVPACCIPPGASLRVHNIPVRIQLDYGVNETEEVTFVEMTDAINTYRDAIQFSNGRQLPMQVLREGQRVEVLSLAVAEPLTEDVLRARRRSEFALR
jgi:hypothetical protein